MPTEITKVDYRYVILDDAASAAGAALATFGELGVGLIGYSEFPHSQGKSQLDLIAEDNESLDRTAFDMGLQLSRKKSAFLIRGDDEPGAAVSDVLKRLAQASVRVISLQAVAVGAGRFGALLWVPQQDIETAAKALQAVNHGQDPVDEASEESFPASDSPAWTL